VSVRGAAYLSFVLMLVVLGYATRQRRRGGLDGLMRAGLVVNLAGTTLLWLRCNKVVEGPILLVLGQRHGLTGSDLFAIPSVLLMGLLARDQRVSARLNRR
jgi:hypothetical protein